MAKFTKMHVYPAEGGETIHIPAATVQGERPGPHAVITAGIHGGEYPPVAAAIQLYKQLDPAQVSGTVTIITVSNVSAFEHRSMFVTPVDGKNPNRCFPGREDGSYTERMVYYLFRDFISKGDLHIDAHCGDLIESLAPFAEYSWGVDPEVDRKSKEIAVYYGLPNVVGEPCDLTKEYAGLNYENSARHGIPSALVEAGQHGQLEQDAVETHLAGMKNVLRHFGVLDGEAWENDGYELFQGVTAVEAPVPGIFYCQVKPGDYLKKGQSIGRLEDYFGTALGEVFAPADGKVLYMTDNPAMIQDGFILDLATKEKI